MKKINWKKNMCLNFTGSSVLILPDRVLILPRFVLIWAPFVLKLPTI